MRFMTSIKIVRVVLAMALSLWVAGAGCMMGCGNMMAAGAHSSTANEALHSYGHSTIVVSGDACASAKSHDCCAKRKSEVRSPPKSQPRQTATTGTTLVNSDEPSSDMEGCPLAVGKAAVVTKSANADVRGSKAAAPESFSANTYPEQAVPFTTPLRLPNRGHTYLRCCVFLI